MKIHAASASASVTRTLEQIIASSGHSTSSAADAELVIVDQLHPTKLSSTCPRIVIGNKSVADVEFLAAPLAPRHLIRLLTNRTATQPATLGNGWQLDASARTLTHTSGTRASVTEKECALLVNLLSAHPEALTHEALLEQVWGVRSGIDTHTLETHIYRLRSKLDGLAPTPCDIVTVGGAYKLAIG